MSRGEKTAIDPSSPARGDNGQVVRSLVMSPEADTFLHELSEQSGLSEGRVLLFALGMFKTAIDAKQEGNHIGVASDRDHLDLELVGF